MQLKMVLAGLTAAGKYARQQEGSAPFWKKVTSFSPFPLCGKHRCYRPSRRDLHLPAASHGLLFRQGSSGETGLYYHVFYIVVNIALFVFPTPHPCFVSLEHMSMCLHILSLLPSRVLINKNLEVLVREAWKPDMAF
jgi:hypothetical protein